MIYKTPFTAISKAIYAALSDNTNGIGLEWFDSAVPIDEINDYFKNCAEFAYGIFGSAEADCTPNKDTAIWDSSLALEIYSNYKGRKIVAEKLEAVLNYISSETGKNAIQHALNVDGFVLVSMTVGPLRINLPIYSIEAGVWQSGSTEITFRVTQLPISEE